MLGFDIFRDRPTIAHAVGSAIILGAAYVIGHALRVLLGGRIARLAARTATDWDDVVVRELQRRVPFWTLLVGALVALEEWNLPPQVLAYAHSGIRSLGILSFTMALAAVLTQLLVSHGPKTSSGSPASALSQNLVRLVAFMAGALAIAWEFGLPVTPYLGVLGVGGLAVGLALQDPLSNLFSGILTGLSSHITIGDYVRVDPNVEGYVMDVDWRITQIRTLANNIVSVPNLKVAQAVVTNFSRPSSEVGVGVEATVDRGSDLALVERVSLDVGRSVMQDVSGGVPAGDVSVRFSAFTDAGVAFTLNVRARTLPDQFLVRHEIIRRLQARFAAEGIAFGQPARSLTVPGPVRVDVKP